MICTICLRSFQPLGYPRHWAAHYDEWERYVKHMEKHGGGAVDFKKWQVTRRTENQMAKQLGGQHGSE